MPDAITLNIIDPKTQKTVRQGTLNVQDEKIIKFFDVKNVTEEGFIKLQEKARNARDIGVLDYYDLTPEEKLAQAKENKYDKYYDIKLSNDGKFFEIKVKPQGAFSPAFNGYDIKADFGLAENVLMNNNKDYVVKHAPAGSTPDGRNTDFDKATFTPDYTIKIPVNEASFNNGPSGWWSRLCT